MEDKGNNRTMENKNALIIPDKKRLAILNGLFYSLTSAIFLCLMIKYKYYLDTFLLGIAMLMGYIVFGARLVLIGGKGYVIDVNGLTVIWFRKWKRFYRWDEFLTARKYMVSAPQVNREAVAEYGGELSTNVCSLIPVRSNRRGEISQAWVLRHPFKVYIFAFDSFHNQIKFESLRRGEIPPDLEDQEPDEEE